MGIATKHISPQIALSAILFAGLAAITYLAIDDQLLKASIVVLIPVGIIFIIESVKHPLIALFSYGTICYFWGIIYRVFIRVSGISILLDIGMLFFLFCMILHSPYSKDVKWRRSFNVMTVAYAIWFVYCFLEITNPNGLTEAWINSRSMYPSTLIFLVLLTAFFTRFKLVKALLIAIAVLTIISFIKLMIQRFIGWDHYEITWLYSSDSYRTHLLRTGIRYFSTFSDAGNHGSNMGNVAIVYSIIFFYTKGQKIRWLYLVTAIMGVIGLFMSGTRGAMIVPLGGLVLFCLMNKSIKLTLTSALVGIAIYIFFAFTYIGEGNAMISRMRTAFRPTQDASFNVRIENQKKMAEYMKDRPFGEGMGLAGVEAQKYGSRYITSFPVDSYYVKIWVQTGIVGLLLHIAVLLTCLFWGCYLIMFKVKTVELRGILTAFSCGLFGLMLSAYGNQFFGQPNTQFVVLTFFACIINGPYIDKRLLEEKQQLLMKS